ncbi:MAG: alpha/beta fold hydrolase [Acidobacteria bacterium]|nr:alpha/beta fold hydrolase [Acidobacteriota bacterium]
MNEFSPPRWLRGGHRMTIYAWARRRSLPGLTAPVPRYFDVEPGTRVLAHCHWHEHPEAHPTIVTLHGLEGSSHAHYMGGIAHKAFPRGFNVVRLNQRNCGGTEHLSAGLYHSGLTKDVIAVCTELAEKDGFPAIAVSGYSLGGNLAIRMAGMLGDAPPRWLCAVAAVSPTLELGSCMTAMERPENRLYEWHFMHSLRRRMRKKARMYPGRYDITGLSRLWSVRSFDDRFTAPHHGFTDAADYYYQMAAARVVDRVRVPALVITAEDDPFIPVEPFHDPAVTGNPFITLRITRHGGHCGFVEDARDGYDGYWAEQQIVDFFAAHVDSLLKRSA